MSTHMESNRLPLVFDIFYKSTGPIGKGRER